MAAYTILKMENLSDALKKKSRLTTCITLALGMFAVTASAVAIGIFIGYTYCYIEHHTLNGNITYRTSNYHILKLPESAEVKGNRTINGALASSALVSRILHLGQAFVEDELTYLPSHGPDSHLVLNYT